MWSLKYNTKWAHLETKTDSQTQRTYLWSPKVRGKDWNLGLAGANYNIYIYIIYYIKILYIGWMNNKGLLYSTGNYIQYPVINHNGKEYEKEYIGTSLVVQWLRLCAPNTGDLGSIPGQGTRSHMSQLIVHSSVQLLSRVQLFVTHGLQHVMLLCSSPTPRSCSNSCPSNRWCHPIISSSVVPSPPAFNLPQHPGLFQWVNSSHQVAKVLEFQLQHQSFQWIFRTHFL